ncbi:MAG: hypothetical protein IPK19_35785 [Chloroflexi bacterium]|nr:hypothetical protein [Chloroflexota bacterium]
MDSGFEVFFRQIPVGLILMFCGSGALLIGALAYIVWSRGRRRRQKDEPELDVVMEVKPMDDDLMPDLDELSHPGAKPAPPPGVSMPQKFNAPPPPPSLDTAPPPNAPARPRASYRLALSDGGSADAVEVFTVLRDVADGTLIVQIGSKAYRHPIEGADADFMRRLNTALRDLNNTAFPAAPTPVSTPLESSAPLLSEPDLDMPSDEDLVDSKPSVESQWTAPPADPVSPSPLPGDLPKYRMEDLPPLTARRGRAAPKVEIPTFNIGAAIETFLQHKRHINGDFPGRKIHVRSGLGGGIVIEVDGQFFDGVSDVTDAEVRTYLQKTIEEWQSRQ